MWLIVAELSIKARWQDAPLVLQDFSQSNKHKCTYLVSNTRMKKEIYYIMSCPITKGISTGNLKTNYFPWPILMRTDCRTSNFCMLLIVPYFSRFKAAINCLVYVSFAIKSLEAKKFRFFEKNMDTGSWLPNKFY